MKKAIIIVVLCMVMLSVSSCHPYNYEIGSWVCEELGITLTINEHSYCSYRTIGGNGEKRGYYERGRGEIIIDGVSSEIICSIDVEKVLYIGSPYIDGSYNEYGTREDWLFVGCTGYINEYEMEYLIFKEGGVKLERNDWRTYTFVKEATAK